MTNWPDPNLHPQLLRKAFQERLRGTMGEWMEMEFREVGPDRLVLRMPVSERHKQPMGLLHGGATAALVETVASFGSALHCPPGSMPVGVEINCNHLRSKTGGWVEAIAKPLHLGRRLHVWDVRVRDEADRLVAVGRCTIAIVPVRRADLPAAEADPEAALERLRENARLTDNLSDEVAQAVLQWAEAQLRAGLIQPDRLFALLRRLNLEGPADPEEALNRAQALLSES
ncbi:MAG: PaaI family thioesterase [Bacteroidota bacterium]|nr:PaaI family thioesterase [Bacteroidota bacterium]MDW8286167.1 PaaI family thioesterase [Bacteroidota bacterium]